MKNLTFTIILLISFSLDNSFAQGSGSSYGSSPRTTGTGFNQNSFEVTSMAKGNLVKIDNEYLTLRTKRKRLITLRLTHDTIYKRQKEEIIFQELAEGQYVKVIYRPKESVIAEDKALTVSILE